MFDHEDLDTTIEVCSYQEVRVSGLVVMIVVECTAVVVVLVAAEMHPSMYDVPYVQLVRFVYAAAAAAVAVAAVIVKLPTHLYSTIHLMSMKTLVSAAFAVHYFAKLAFW